MTKTYINLFLYLGNKYKQYIPWLQTKSNRNECLRKI